MKFFKYLGGSIAILAAAVILFAISPIAFGICAVVGLAYLGAKAFT